MTGPTTSHHWPILGRESAAAEVAEILGRRALGGVLLSGPAGVGKTALAAQVAASVQAGGGAALRLVATPAGSLVPYGTLAGLRDLVPDPSTTPTVASVQSALEQAIRDRQPDHSGELLLVIDDAPLIDRSTAALVAELVRSDRVVALATARDGGLLPPELDGLLVEGSLVRYPVRPLDAAAIRRAAEYALGGPLHLDAATTLFEASRGVPLHARELVQVNLANGHLGQDDGLWSFTHPPIAPVSLVHLVSSRFGTLGPDERRVFEIVALAQPLPISAAVSLADATVLAALERAELIVVSEDDVGHGPVVRLGHPLYDDVVRAASGPLHLRAVAERAAEALDNATEPNAELGLRAACLRLDHELPLEPEAAVAAARRALALVDPKLAERLVRLAGDGFDAPFVLGTALIAQGRHDEADDALRAAFAGARDDGERARVISRRGNNLGTGAGRFEDSIAILEAGLAEIEDPRWRSFVEADLAYARLWTGVVASDVGGGSGSQLKPAAVRANECLVGAVVAVMRGELAEAERFVADGLPIASALRDDVPTARELLTLSRFLSLAFAGRSHEARRVVADEIHRVAEHGATAEAAGSWIAVRSMQDLYDGDAPQAIANAIDAEARLASVDISGLRPVVQAIRATALARLGDVAGSLAADGTVDPIWRSETKVRVQLAVAAGWRAAASGEYRRGAVACAEAGIIGLDLNHVAFGAFAAHDAARLGYPRLALPVLLAAAERLEGPLIRALVAHAELIDAGEAEALLSLAPTLPALGFTLSGAEAASHAARLFEQAGAMTDARRAEFVASQLAEPLDGVRSPTLGRPRGLTPREQEIARLAAEGQRSREIGEVLAISARTVDNHLAAIFRKLGVASRNELGAHL